MKGKELAQMVADGIHPVVTFKAPVLDKEGYLEAGMRGRLVAISDEHDDMFQLHVDLAEFDDFNRQFESANFYDKNGRACLTAREAGVYKEPKEWFFVGNDDEIDFCEVEEAPRCALYAEYQKTASSLSYVQWLEDRLLAISEASVG